MIFLSLWHWKRQIFEVSLCFNAQIIAHDSHCVAKHVQALDKWQEVWQNGPLHTHHDAASRAWQLEAWWHHGFQESSVLGVTKTRHLCQQNSIWFSLLRNFTMQQFKMYNIFLFFDTTFALLFSVCPKESSHWTSGEPVFVKGKPQWRSTKGVTDRNEILKSIYTNSPFQSVSWPILTNVWTSQKHDRKCNHFVQNCIHSSVALQWN